MELERQRRFLRVFFYVLGMVLLAFGISLNKKMGLGVSPIVSVAYCVSQIGGIQFRQRDFWTVRAVCAGGSVGTSVDLSAHAADAGENAPGGLS